MAGLGDLIVVVEDLTTYQAAVNAGKTAPSVMYLILAERQVYFNGELWSKAPEEGGGGGGGDTEELEEVAAAAFNDLDSRHKALIEELRGDYTQLSLFRAEIERMTNIIIENEEIVAQALGDLNARLKPLE